MRLPTFTRSSFTPAPSSCWSCLTSARSATSSASSAFLFRAASSSARCFACAAVKRWMRSGSCLWVHADSAACSVGSGCSGNDPPSSKVTRDDQETLPAGHSAGRVTPDTSVLAVSSASVSPSRRRRLLIDANGAPGTVDTSGTPIVITFDAIVAVARISRDTGECPLTKKLRPPPGAKKDCTVACSSTRSEPNDTIADASPSGPAPASALQPDGPVCSRTWEEQRPWSPAATVVPGGSRRTIWVIGGGSRRIRCLPLSVSRRGSRARRAVPS